jgi:signal transduction histidine kinase/CheY-like chemotaxis protein
MIGLRARDGTEHWISVDAHPIDRTPGVRWVAASYKDVSERRRIEAALATAEASDRAKGEFLSRMSHELRTPLNSVLGFAQLLHMGELDPRAQEAVDQILIAGRHLLGLLDDVLDLERIEAGRLEVRLESVALGAALRETVELVQPLAAKHAVTMRLLAPSDGVRVLADEQRLRQVLLNLLTNAIKYNRPDGTVTVSTAGDEDAVRVRVSDTGAGLTGVDIAKLFVPFERLDADRRGIEGAGVGLALAKRLTEAMGGHIGVDSTPDDGSTFWCSFLPDPQAGPLPDRDEAPRAEAARESVLPSPRILYIEDNAANRLLVEHIAARSGRFVLETAASAAAGLTQAEQSPPDAILLDLQLPDASGEQVLDRLRTSARTRAVPVVVVTADASPDRRRRLLEAGARAYLTKPLDVPAVFTALDDVLTDTEP